jgi:hypothetical protein
MAINRSFVSTNSTEKYNSTNIEILSSQPSLNGTLATAKRPGQVLGYYNGATDTVTLYVVLGSGLRVARVG